MATLGAGRASDATLVSQVDDVIQALELDICEILGIEPGQPVNASIFGLGAGAGGDGYPIQADGSIRSIIKLTLGIPTTSPNTACGFEFSDSNESYRIVLVDSELRLYQDQGGTWVLINTLSAPIERLVDLSDVDMPTLDSSVDGYRVVVDTVTLSPDHFFKLVPPPAGEAFKILEAEDIVAPSLGFVGQRLTLFQDVGGAFFVGYDPATAGAPIPFPVGTLTDTAGVPVPLEAASAGSVFMQGYGSEAANMTIQPALVGAAGATISVPGNEWTNVPFAGSTFQTGNGWRTGEFFSDTSQIITMPEPGFYFVKYTMTWPQDARGSIRGIRLVVNAGTAQVGNTWRFSPSFRIQDGANIISNNDPLIAFDFIRANASSSLRLQLFHNAGDASVVLSCDVSIGLVKIR